MKVTKAITLLISGMGCLAGQAWASEVPEYVSIRGVQTAGSGCPLGTVARNVSPDKKAFTLTFSEYLAEVFPGALPSDSRRNCNITVDLDFPTGWTFSVVSFDYRGYVVLDEGVSATTEASYYFQSGDSDVKFSSTVEGDIAEDYHFRDQVALASAVWSPTCEGVQRPLNLKTDIRLSAANNPDGQGFLTIDSLDGEFKQKYALVWKRCDNNGGGNPGGGNDDDDYRPPYDDQFPDAPNAFTIKNMTYNGTGCPLGTVANTISNDRRAFTLIYDSFVAEAGPGISLRESRKFCQLTMDIEAPSGWSFALSTFDYRGYAYLEPGVKAEQAATYYYQGANPGKDIKRSTTLAAQNAGDYFDDDYRFRDYVPVGDLSWSPCGKQRALNVKAEVRLDNRSARSNSGLVTMDSTDGEFGVYHGLVWKRCR
ncbi:MAG: DUF4360 domain-containing protein [Oligoflexus sp.]